MYIIMNVKSTALDFFGGSVLLYIESGSLRCIAGRALLAPLPEPQPAATVAEVSACDHSPSRRAEANKERI